MSAERDTVSWSVDMAGVCGIYFNLAVGMRIVCEEV